MYNIKEVLYDYFKMKQHLFSPTVRCTSCDSQNSEQLYVCVCVCVKTELTD